MKHLERWTLPPYYMGAMGGPCGKRMRSCAIRALADLVDFETYSYDGEGEDF